MAKKSPVDGLKVLVGLLAPLDSGERLRLIRAALLLLGEDEPAELGGGGAASGGKPKPPGGSGTGSAKAFFDEKDPQSKGEELAVAVRFLEEGSEEGASKREDVERVVKSARRNFDARNYKRDLENARQKGLFTRGAGKDALTLSHYGQKYVDALPDRANVKALKRPKGAGGRRPGRKPSGGAKRKTGR